ncbi:MAG: hypothetical protein M1495_22430 [Bacteroidetes bacterium]|nr:hypothetical protein [Bacteroidota bacterium]
MILCAVLTFFGLIHSAMPDRNMYLPWQLPAQLKQIPFQFAIGYFVLAVMMFLFSFTKESKVPYTEDE